MLIAERHSRLKDLVAQRGVTDLDSLARELNVSQSTVRRDLDALESEGFVKRTHGGVIWTGDRAPGAPPNPRAYAFDQRMSVATDLKLTIAKAAAKLVQPGQTILLDGGTTTFHLAEQLLGQHLQLVTNSLPIASLFLNDENVELILTGGLLYPRYGVLLGPLAEQTLATVHTHTLFLSVAGIHDGHLYNQNMLLVESERRMMHQAKETVLLADSTKFGQQALSRLCDLPAIHTVISDPGLAPEHRNQVEAAGCRLIIAE